MDSQAVRGSTSSGRSSGSSRRAQNPQQQLSQIEKSVTHLLVATKQLLETLTQWSRGSATEGEVSDVYVRLGYEFNIACRAFNAIGVDTHDLGPVPDLLRTILEDTLSQEASQASLDRFLPRIRDIIINLLQGLKKKQSRLRARTAREFDKTPGNDDGPSAPGHNIAKQRSKEILSTEIPPRTTSRNEGRASPSMQDGSQSRLDRFESRGTLNSLDSSLSSITAQSLPVTAPYPTGDTIPTGPGPAQPTPPPHMAPANFPPPPPPPPEKTQDALLALQRGGDLERRASRRFSTYQINKQLGSAIGIPPAQTSPAPNRGREVRESIQAVRQRGSRLYNRDKTERRLVGEPSPTRNMPPKISEESMSSRYKAEPSSSSTRKTSKSTNEHRGDFDNAEFSATVSGPIPDAIVPETTTPTAPPARKTSGKREREREREKEKEPSPSTSAFVPEESPQPGKELTLFLQYKSKVKKFILEDGYNDLSVARLQLAFIDKFAWNTHSNGIDLPEIYIQDSVSGVRYELEDLNDIKNNSVLVLNVEPLDEVKRHFDDGIGGLRRVVEGIKTTIDNQQSAIERVSDRQQEAAKEIAHLATAPPPAMSRPAVQSSSSSSSITSPKFNKDSLAEIQTVRRQVAVMRQTYSSLMSDVEAAIATVRTKAKGVKSAAVTAALPSLDGDSGRAYIKAGLYGTLSKDQTVIIERVDDVQDSIEDLRKDVVTRGVRPLPRQLEQVAKDLSNATADVKRLEAFMQKEMPLWNKIWKQELQQVCDDREAIAETEALIADMKLDLEESEKTFRLVEEACKQQNIMAASGPNAPGVANSVGVGGGPVGGARSSSGSSAKVPGLALRSGPLDPQRAKDGVLHEVKGLQVDHESRVEAIERAERARQRELESRKEGEFKKELSGFVEEGKLKKSGGVEEAERLRRAKDERIRKEVWERQQARGAAGSSGAAPMQNGETAKT